MARPQKQGLDYFPIDTNMDQDDKIALIESKHSVTGFGVLIKLLNKQDYQSTNSGEDF